MRKLSIGVFAVVAIAAATAFACDASISVLEDNGNHWITRSVGAPPGSYVEAVIVHDDVTTVVDHQPVDPALGLAVVSFPCGAEDRFVVLRNSEGIALDSDCSDGVLELD